MAPDERCRLLHYAESKPPVDCRIKASGGSQAFSVKAPRRFVPYASRQEYFDVPEFAWQSTGCRAQNMLRKCYADSFFFFHFIKWRDIISCKEKGKEKLTAAGQALIYSSSRNTRDFNREIRAQSETRLHREYNLAMKNKSLRRIAAAQRGRCFAPCAARQER